MSKRYKQKRRERYYRELYGDDQPLMVDCGGFQCWCGVKNPYCAPIHENCGGCGTLYCYCGGDICVCHNHGEIECPGCPDCNGSDDEDLWEQDPELEEDLDRV